MAEIAVSFVINQLVPLIRDEANLLRGIHNEFADIKNELESIQAFLKDADTRVSRGDNNNSTEGVKTWVKQVIEASLRIQDIIDDYMIHVAHYQSHNLVTKFGHLIKTLIPRHRIASEIKDIKSSLRGIKERSERYGFQVQYCFEQGSGSSRGNHNAKWHDPRVAALYIEETEVVGFEVPRERLIDWLVNGRAARTVVSVVGMGGQGKTTLVKKVYDSKEIIRHYDCRVWITVSQSYSVEGLLRDMLRKFHNNSSRDNSEMDRGSLIDEVRNYLQQKRYLVVFDDVWNMHFWNEFESSLIDNKNGSKILITTRSLDVALSCKKSSFVELHELQPLTKEQSLELFNKTAFRFEFDGCCPKELVDISSLVVEKCKGLPLAIVAIAGLLSMKEKNAFEWQRFSENLSLELKKNSHLLGIKEILGFSYDDLPFYLKSCLLYFGLYPEDYEVTSKRLIRQWIAKGFVKEERGKTLEEVADGYLTELIHRNLVQVSSISVDGKPKRCRVHDLMHMMILEKFEDLSFCQHINEDVQSSIATISNDLMASTKISHVRSLIIFTNKSELPEYFLRTITTKYRLLKVLDFENAPLFTIPRNMGSLIHLKYLSFKNARVIQIELPKSIGMLQNLETLDLRGTNIHKVPKEIIKLRKLRHLLGNRLSLNLVKDGIGGMTSLQTLRNVRLDANGMVELEKLKQLRKLSLVDVKGEHGSTLSSSVSKIQHLQKLHIKSNPENKDETIPLHLSSAPHMLRKLRLFMKLEKLPKWILELQNLVELRLMLSQLTDDPIKSLKHMQNLLVLSIWGGAYKGESLHFEDGVFHKLKELFLGYLDNLNSIIINEGALHSLIKLHLWENQLLKTVPSGVQHLEKLEYLGIGLMPAEFVQSIAPDGGKDHWTIKHVTTIEIATTDGTSIQHSSN